MSPHLALLIFALGCGGFQAPPPKPEPRHPCDPKGNTDEPSPFDPSTYLSRELDASELALAETTCRDPDASQQTDEVLVQRCSTHAETAAPAQRSSCRHACIAMARSEAAGFALSNVVNALRAVAQLRERAAPALDHCMKMFAAGTPVGFREVHDGRDLWTCLGLPTLPPEFVVQVTHERSPKVARLVELSVRGSTAALPMRDLRVSLVDYGCGVSHWSVGQQVP